MRRTRMPQTRGEPTIASSVKRWDVNKGTKTSAFLTYCRTLSDRYEIRVLRRRRRGPTDDIASPRIASHERKCDRVAARSVRIPSPGDLERGTDQDQKIKA